MHLLKELGAMTIFGVLIATTAAAPAPAAAADGSPAANPLNARAALTDHTAIVNVYTGDSCGGSASSFTASGSGTSVCHPVGNARSIQVSAKYVYTKSIHPFPLFLWGGKTLSFFSDCKTTTWSGGNCQGSSKNIPNSSCYSVLFAAVKVTC